MQSRSHFYVIIHRSAVLGGAFHGRGEHLLLYSLLTLFYHRHAEQKGKSIGSAWLIFSSFTRHTSLGLADQLLYFLVSVVSL